MNNPLISIIIPIYNAEKKLRTCLDSILSQSFSDWECLLIDDGSIDNSGKICEEYANSNDKFIVVHKENGGVSSARNLGIRESKGKWLSFIDADDHICEDYLAKLAEKQDADLILCGFKSSQGIDFLSEDNHWGKESISNGIDYLVNDRYLLYTPWCKLFKASIVKSNQLYFNTSICLSEDTVFSYQYLYYVQSVRIVRANGYFYDGIWGGGKKYVLTLNDVLYIQKTQVEAIKRLNSRFNCSIDYKYKGYWYPLVKGLYSDLTLRKIYNCYCQNNEYLSWEEFQKDKLLNLLTNSFETCVNTNSKNNVKHVYNDIRRFYEGTTLGTNGLSCSVKIFTILMSRRLHMLNILFLNIYIKIKRGKTD